MSRRIQRALVVAGILALAAVPAAALFKVCIDAGECHECDWYDASGNLVSSIYWCWSN